MFESIPYTQHYREHGYCVFDYDDSIQAWVESSLAAARSAISDSQNQHWFRHQNTWFVGVNALANDEKGRVGDGPELKGRAIDFIEKVVTRRTLHVDRAQISVFYQGYPKPSSSESEAAYKYRLRRDAAHVDGIMRDGEHRYLVEYHDYILAIPMVDYSHDASPFVAWQGSHSIIQNALSTYLNDYPTDQWKSLPISDVYNQARKHVFANCQRIELALQPGQAFVGHRHLLHGTAPWGASAMSGPDGRMVCFFRPETRSIEQWVRGDNTLTLKS